MSQLKNFLDVVDCLQRVHIAGASDFNFNMLIQLYSPMRCISLFEEILSKCSQTISQEELKTIEKNYHDILPYVLSLSFAKNKFILSDRTIENMSNMKRLAV